mmetsp:Transcript_49826/g.106058  ORF Transcript_49826/g.106058 Transcript_49826/m.106058 type:complete len:167 (-) Transcript_49826:209-709(-)|eukprot:CAMPEP_0206478872 /NCGR_PEP_ID=MMETSP0324_2-20121206/36346_1 /ASSEMBLY_ACC=CAM_ASM_000836 /TAXON_ID=2866 /ORGANISM="Crypthecodinium cohnii, Strain Seligo" /LENGTH=166 /DNA_ID=CAMNT_0053955329 /DNA_START=220 /DNA_END=720 /DNA_ORIENTATION=-
MARIGVANYIHSADNPVHQDQYWRTVIERGQRDHHYSPFNEPCPKASYAYISTSANDAQARPWELLNMTKVSAAGKGSFHHNISQPQGSIVKVHSSASHAFERSRGPSSTLGRSASASFVRPGPVHIVPRLEGAVSDRFAPSLLDQARLGSARSSSTISRRSRRPA